MAQAIKLYFSRSLGSNSLFTSSDLPSIIILSRLFSHGLFLLASNGEGALNATKVALRALSWSIIRNRFQVHIYIPITSILHMLEDPAFHSILRKICLWSEWIPAFQCGVLPGGRIQGASPDILLVTREVLMISSRECVYLLFVLYTLWQFKFHGFLILGCRIRFALQEANPHQRKAPSYA